MQRAPVFEETYQNYIKQIQEIDYLARAEILGARKTGDTLEIKLFNDTYWISRSGIETVDGSPVTPAVRVILAQYVLMCPPEIPHVPDRYMTYREFKDAAPLTSYFTANTNKIIETTFSGKSALLAARALRLGGTVQENESYDLSVSFQALPRIPMGLNFNDADDLFPATCSILYRSSAEFFLDMECLAMTGTLLAGSLITSDDKDRLESGTG